MIEEREKQEGKQIDRTDRQMERLDRGRQTEQIDTHIDKSTGWMDR